MSRSPQFVTCALTRPVQAFAKLRNPISIDIVPNDTALLSKLNGERQANISKAYDGNFFMFKRNFGHKKYLFLSVLEPVASPVAAPRSKVERNAPMFAINNAS